MSAGVTHVVAGGFCVVCGDTEEWLRERYGDAAVVEQCGSTYIAGFSAAFDCVRALGHEGDHRSFGGSSRGAT